MWTRLAIVRSFNLNIVSRCRKGLVSDYGLPLSTRAEGHQENSDMLIRLEAFEYVSSLLERYRSVHTEE
jgi:hypothetical protein